MQGHVASGSGWRGPRKGVSRVLEATSCTAGPCCHEQHECQALARREAVLEAEAVEQGCDSDLEIAQHLVGTGIHVTLQIDHQVVVSAIEQG